MHAQKLTAKSENEKEEPTTTTTITTARTFNQGSGVAIVVAIAVVVVVVVVVSTTTVVSNKVKTMRKDGAPSKTAEIIAHLVLILGGNAYGRSCLPDGALQATKDLIRAGRMPYWWCIWYFCNPFHALLAWLIGHYIVHPNFIEGVGMRKVYIQQAVECFVTEQLQQQQDDDDDDDDDDKKKNKTKKTTKRPQVLVLAAGYDTLAMRLAPQYKDADFFEIDHPSTARVKQKAIRQLFQEKASTTKTSSSLSSFPSNLYLEAQDLEAIGLRHALQDVLSHDFDCTAPTIVVVEGLTMYLNEATVIQILDDVAACVPVGSRIVLDHLGWKNGRIDAGVLLGIMMWMMEVIREPWKWGKDPADLQEFVSKKGSGVWTVIQQHDRIGLENVAVLQKD